MIGKREQQRQSAFGAYYKNCDCDECAYVKAQLNANRSPAESKNDAPREMTADDLALDPLTAYDMLSPQDLEKLPSSVLQHLSMLDTDVAYAFWLGAEAA